MVRRYLAAVVALLVLSACAEPSSDPTSDAGVTPDAGADKPDEGEVTDGKFDRWDYASDPDRFEGGLNHKVDELPRSGRAASIAWPSTYWPTYYDSVQYRWNGELSPAEKYDRAFNGWTPPEGFDDLRPFNPENCDAESWDTEYYESLGPLATHVSRNMGNRRSRDGVDSDSDTQVDECDDHDGVATWWGLCHAWVPASILEDPPQRSVTYNGVTFHVGDLEALLILAYNRSEASMLGGRCNLFDTAEEMARANGCRLPEDEAAQGDTRPECTQAQLEDYVIRRDAQGRPEQAECRDTNAGAMHVIMTNYLGLQQRAFAEDRTYDYEVWNQPVVGFQVSRMDEVTAAEANALLGAEGEQYAFNEDAVKFYDVSASLTYITESHASTVPANANRYERQDHYTYILEVDGNGDIIGGEFYGDSQERHPDFLWMPRRRTRSAVPNLDLEQVRMLVAMSREPEAPSVGSNVIVASGTGGAIPDDDTAGLSASVEVTEDAPVGSVRLELDIDHTYVGDLRVTLEHEGVTAVVHNNEGGSADDIHTTVTVPGFEGTSSAGTWTLSVVDHAARDIGTLNSWAVRITPGAGSSTGNPSGDGLTVEGTGGDIPDNSDVGFSSTVNVTGEGTVSAVRIRAEVEHPYIGDLRARISHNGVDHVLHGNVGGDRDDISADLVVHTFDGLEASGDWTLTVVDSAARDVGRVVSWGISVTVGDPPPLEPEESTNEPTSFPGEGELAIPDNDTNGVTSEAGVPAGTTGSSVAVAVNIEHTWRGDLVVGVRHGEDTWVLTDHEGDSADDFVETIVLDPAPTGDLGGTWQLRVRDEAAQDVGTLNSWSVVVTP